MSLPDEREAIRAAARSFEQELPAETRKRLGQFFTGIPLGKLLAHLAIEQDTRTVLDPMAGHGDLLDATWEAASERGTSLEHLDGIELDEKTALFCKCRLDRLVDCPHRVILGSAFNADVIDRLSQRRYGLVITNPPYVRYQSQNGNGGKGSGTRSGLQTVIDGAQGVQKTVWATVTRGYSGLADLSIPAWLLAGFMVEPGGKLALVVPATWRSREYADVIRYLLLRCFTLECVVEDTQPGWFSDALVRTHLIVARRLADKQADQPLHLRKHWPIVPWLYISSKAASQTSLVGAAFPGDAPEAECATWLFEGTMTARPGIKARRFDLHEEWNALQAKVRRRTWFEELEGHARELSLFSTGKTSHASTPEAARDLLARVSETNSLMSLEAAGINVGQGLRTGCNQFFYVDYCDQNQNGSVRIKTSALFGHAQLSVPQDALRPVLRRQSELACIERRDLPPGRVLDLRHWILPEDAEEVAAAESAYAACGRVLPQIMPDALAAFVREAAQVPLDDDSGRRISNLSAVRTNVRPQRSPSTTPRFWYMLPDFMPRHLPAVFVPRVINGAPSVQCNLDPPILIDANFSTFWTTDRKWPPAALKALLASAWCCLMMEALGTPLGGGALKLEAAHIRQMPLPPLDEDRRAQLNAEGLKLRAGITHALANIDSIVLQALCPEKPAAAARLARAARERAETLRVMRHKITA